MSTHKAGGKTVHKSPRPGKRLGVKVSGGQTVKVGSIIVRQRGTKIHAGEGIGVGRDHTLFALKPGVLQFATKLGKKIVRVVVEA